LKPGDLAIYFDAAFTLIKPKKSVGELYAEVAQKFDCNPDAQTLNQNFKPAFQAARKKRDRVMIGDEVETKSFWRQVVTDIYERSDEKLPPDPYFEVLYDAFATKDFWELYFDSLDAVMLAKTSGFKVGLLSNFDSRLRPIIRDLDIKRLFDTIVISYDVKVEKPDPEIFKVAEKKLPADNHIIIGDTIKDDIEGGLNAGWYPVHLDREQKEDVLKNELYKSTNNLISAVQIAMNEFGINPYQLGGCEK